MGTRKTQNPQFPPRKIWTYGQAVVTARQGNLSFAKAWPVVSRRQRKGLRSRRARCLVSLDCPGTFLRVCSKDSEDTPSESPSGWGRIADCHGSRRFQIFTIR